MLFFRNYLTTKEWLLCYQVRTVSKEKMVLYHHDQTFLEVFHHSQNNSLSVQRVEVKCGCFNSQRYGKDSRGSARLTVPSSTHVCSAVELPALLDWAEGKRSRSKCRLAAENGWSCLRHSIQKQTHKKTNSTNLIIPVWINSILLFLSKWRWGYYWSDEHWSWVGNRARSQLSMHLTVFGHPEAEGGTGLWAGLCEYLCIR